VFSFGVNLYLKIINRAWFTKCSIWSIQLLPGDLWHVQWTTDQWRWSGNWWKEMGMGFKNDIVATRTNWVPAKELQRSISREVAMTACTAETIASCKSPPFF